MSSPSPCPGRAAQIRVVSHPDEWPAEAAKLRERREQAAAQVAAAVAAARLAAVRGALRPGRLAGRALGRCLGAAWAGFQAHARPSPA
jgi:hypothetical protein